jgi:cell division protein FtsB
MSETQTTAERIEILLERHLTLVPLMVGVDSDSAEIGGIARVSQTIAAEIDALTRERDEARAEVAKLKEQNRILATTSLRDVIKSVHPSGRARGQ